jgi:hypothetical protein
VLHLPGTFITSTIPSAALYEDPGCLRDFFLFEKEGIAIVLGTGFNDSNAGVPKRWVFVMSAFGMGYVYGDSWALS